MNIVKNRFKLECTDTESDHILQVIELIDELVTIMDDNEVNMIENDLYKCSYDEIVDMGSQLFKLASFFDTEGEFLTWLYAEDSSLQ